MVSTPTAAPPPPPARRLPARSAAEPVASPLVSGKPGAVRAGVAGAGAGERHGPPAPLASTPRVTRPPSAQFADIRRYQELVQGGGSFYKISESAPPPRALCRLWS